MAILLITPHPGDTLDHYRLDKEVAQGGMSTLFKATDLHDGKTVAIKVPHEGMKTDPILAERFKREQLIGQELDHPGIVKAYNGEQRSQVYMVMEWVDGQLLRSIMNQEQPLPIGRAIKLTHEICEALDYMHKHGVVHRDLKPENVMVSGQDRIKLIDFGVAMKADARRLTYASPSPILGTPDYISPEQVKGERGDPRSDIYSLGIMLYEMLTGQTPFSGPNSLAVMNERLQNDPVPARRLRPEISPALQEILYRALERNPRHRYATASEMDWDLTHQEQVGVEEGAQRITLHGQLSPGKRKLLIYATLTLVPLALFGLMLLLAR